jgi:hypothetical protein
MDLNMDVDDEWEKFMSLNNSNELSSDDESDEVNEFIHPESILSANILNEITKEAPKPSEIYISTKTKIAYLNSIINLKQLFWDIPVQPYYKPSDCVVKKQMKFNSFYIEELDFIKEKLKDLDYYDEHVITSINNPTGRIKFKDIRKISIGVSKKDLLSYRCKKKSAFYNCFVLILRMKVNETFKEFHVKVFNTGKIEIPGIQSEVTFQLILKLLLQTLQPFVSETLEFKDDTSETVLINSNFNCGFFINREILNDILKNKYNIQCIYDPCSYPGIQCKFYYNEDIDIQNGCIISEENKTKYKNVKEVSFMIFRTGSVLIVGKCDESVLIVIYEFLKRILHNEFNFICQKKNKMELEEESNSVLKDKNKKIRRKSIMINVSI